MDNFLLIQKSDLFKKEIKLLLLKYGLFVIYAVKIKKKINPQSEFASYMKKYIQSNRFFLEVLKKVLLLALKIGVGLKLSV
jgi:hypothetical protein